MEARHTAPAQAEAIILEAAKVRDNTLVIFLIDNGESPNDRIRRGEFGTPGTMWNVGAAWANVSSTPFQFYKRTQHSGGLTMACIAQSLAAIQPRAEYEDHPCHITDILPTLIDRADWRIGSSSKEAPDNPALLLLSAKESAKGIQLSAADIERLRHQADGKTRPETDGELATKKNRKKEKAS
jgi:arylsulfatase A-like enzyme